jgi:hypothetical protein
MVACGSDTAALTATGLVRGELADPDYWLRWSPFEEVVDALAETAPGRWLEWFRTRYLDFSPVAHKLAAGDPRLAGADPGALTVDAFAELLAAGQEVLGKGGVVDELVRGKRALSNAIDAGGLSQRAASLAEDLKALQHAIDDASS